MSIYWADEELVITVYFASRGYTDAAVSDVLCVRGYQRSAAAVRRKVEVVVKQYTYLLSPTGKWNVNKVDWWLDNLSLTHDAVNELIRCNASDTAIAEEHQIIDSIMDTMAQASGGAILERRLVASHVASPSAPSTVSTLNFNVFNLSDRDNWK
ncbi:hypothetical protein FE257_007078, partial [Aspergillus nanangensis]